MPCHQTPLRLSDQSDPCKTCGAPCCASSRQENRVDSASSLSQADTAHIAQGCIATPFVCVVPFRQVGRSLRLKDAAWSQQRQGCGVNDGIHRNMDVCDNKNNGGGFDPPRWASARSQAHAPTWTSTWTSTRQPVRDPVSHGRRHRRGRTQREEGAYPLLASTSMGGPSAA